MQNGYNDILIILIRLIISTNNAIILKFLVYN